MQGVAPRRPQQSHREPESSRISDEADLEWNVLLAPHHCSKTVMYVADDDGNDVLDSELMSKIEDAGGECRYIVSSSEPIPSRNQSGDNPPHAKAKNRYEEVVETRSLSLHTGTAIGG